MVDLYVRLPDVVEEGEAHALQVLHGDFLVEDPGVFPLYPQVHGERDTGLSVTYLGDSKE